VINPEHFGSEYGKVTLEVYAAALKGFQAFAEQFGFLANPISVISLGEELFWPMPIFLILYFAF
jgi:hypothetical protein